jgi:acyl carrier protein
MVVSRTSTLESVMADEPESTAPPPSEADVVRLIHELIVELAPNPTGAAAEDPRLVEDLEYHSLALMELAFTLEDEFALEPIDEETALSILTVGDVDRHVLDELRRRDVIVSATAGGGG